MITVQDTRTTMLPAAPHAKGGKGPVAATQPPADWDGNLPRPGAWPALCARLEPCPRNGTGGPCRVNGEPHDRRCLRRAASAARRTNPTARPSFAGSGSAAQDVERRISPRSTPREPL